MPYQQEGYYYIGYTKTIDIKKRLGITHYDYVPVRMKETLFSSHLILTDKPIIYY